MSSTASQTDKIDGLRRALITLGHVGVDHAVARAQLPDGPPSLRTLAGLNATVSEQAAMIA